MKLCIISDTHGKHKQLELPDADMIIHCGDSTSMGKEHEIHKFMKWFSKLEQYKYKIIIAGNHDWLFERNRLLAKTHIPDNIHYLEDSEVIIEGIKFYGSPVQKIFYNWAFNRSEAVLANHWKAIPDDVDVLITHSPPYGIGDYVYNGYSNDGNQGSPSLYKEIFERIRPKIHAMGHIHEGYGIKTIDGIKFINASNLDGNYYCVNKPVVVEI
ncbi:MAG: metallophosphatase domain-containing protein [Bacteroidales bacterium]|jgi:Icc-related predicted phosphoesterase|nr:metallophosphatase domain-containing protein [Bacteroidales bacterium]